MKRAEHGILECGDPAPLCLSGGRIRDHSRFLRAISYDVQKRRRVAALQNFHAINDQLFGIVPKLVGTFIGISRTGENDCEHICSEGSEYRRVDVLSEWIPGLSPE
jgi:hypothetical protein